MGTECKDCAYATRKLGRWFCSAGNVPDFADEVPWWDYEGCERFSLKY